MFCTFPLLLVLKGAISSFLSVSETDTPGSHIYYTLYEHRSMEGHALYVLLNALSSVPLGAEVC
jgi:hypothetical protein